MDEGVYRKCQFVDAGWEVLVGDLADFDLGNFFAEEGGVLVEDVLGVYPADVSLVFGQ